MQYKIYLQPLGLIMVLMSMRLFQKDICSIFMACFFLCGSNIVCAQTIDGSWASTNSVNFFGQKQSIILSKVSYVQALKNQIVLSPICVADLLDEPRLFPEVFKNLIKRGASKSEIEIYVSEKFGIEVSRKIKAFRFQNEDRECLNNFKNIIIQDNKMIILGSGGTFYGYKRKYGMEGPKAFSDYSKNIITPFPFSPQNYSLLCDPLVRRINKVPHPTKKCEPLYYAYVAKNENASPMESIIGHHNFIKGNPKYYNDYDDPFRHNLHPLYVVLPPLKDVQLVRVDDHEGNADERDMFSGAYLSIKNGKVIDQLNHGCDMIEGHVCVDDDGNEVFKLLDSGKFAEIKR